MNSGALPESPVPSIPSGQRLHRRIFGNLHLLTAVAGGLLGLAAPGYSTPPVEYVRICSLYGEGYHYLPGTDICFNSATGDARVQTDAGEWRTLLPYPEGKWVTSNLQPECSPGKLVTLGTFKSTDFTLNGWNRKQTQPVTLNLKAGEFISKVIMSGGFYDPRIPERHGVNGFDGLCIRSMDPNVIEVGATPANPPFGNAKLPIGCVANSRLVNMPAAYSISATAAYPNIDAFILEGSGTVSGPYTYGSKLLVTTDLRPEGAEALTYLDGAIRKPLAGTLTASVCVDGK
jgi:hypothetical protein